jgi:hypothetical protein
VPPHQEHLKDQAPGRTLRDVYALLHSAPLLRVVSPEMALSYCVVTRAGKTARPSECVGVWPAVLEMNLYEVEHGRFFTDLDEELARPGLRHRHRYPRRTVGVARKRPASPSSPWARSSKSMARPSPWWVCLNTTKVRQPDARVRRPRKRPTAITKKTQGQCANAGSGPSIGDAFWRKKQRGLYAPEKPCGSDFVQLKWVRQTPS